MILNLIAFGLYDFSYRLHHKESDSIKNNKVAYVLEIITNVFFTIELIAQLIVFGLIFDNNCYLRKPEGIFNFIIFVLK